MTTKTCLETHRLLVELEERFRIESSSSCCGRDWSIWEGSSSSSSSSPSASSPVLLAAGIHKLFLDVFDRECGRWHVRERGKRRGREASRAVSAKKFGKNAGIGLQKQVKSLSCPSHLFPGRAKGIPGEAKLEGADGFWIKCVRRRTI